MQHCWIDACADFTAVPLCSEAQPPSRKHFSETRRSERRIGVILLFEAQAGVKAAMGGTAAKVRLEGLPTVRGRAGDALAELGEGEVEASVEGSFAGEVDGEAGVEDSRDAKGREGGSQDRNSDAREVLRRGSRGDGNVEVAIQIARYGGRDLGLLCTGIASRLQVSQKEGGRAVRAANRRGIRSIAHILQVLWHLVHQLVLGVHNDRVLRDLVRDPEVDVLGIGKPVDRRASSINHVKACPSGASHPNKLGQSGLSAPKRDDNQPRTCSWAASGSWHSRFLITPDGASTSPLSGSYAREVETPDSAVRFLTREAPLRYRPIAASQGGWRFVLRSRPWDAGHLCSPAGEGVGSRPLPARRRLPLSDGQAAPAHRNPLSISPTTLIIPHNHSTPMNTAKPSNLPLHRYTLDDVIVAKKSSGRPTTLIDISSDATILDALRLLRHNEILATAVYGRNGHWLGAGESAVITKDDKQLANPRA
ncbi:hypothetical protein BDK51DRAFT_47896 [Blyttiomyces helicus]|uniref:CBS domain-containing protein n=1 Tax=Blyttiomyces helicus TaxID=388810 RepID=A0A4P9VZR5_9FUNG|nr:hypothetical protein BDK51DRAFT_47896 [Blyttiomyces helicus]|eukprot:RKO83888.1 hypothetical protein BDK51DRAFT_47896 [Blyttiomyces helicus]